MYARCRVVALALLLVASPLLGRPNFVFFLIDDMGYMDVGANNPDTFYETPNIDRLAHSGMRFTNGYAANPVCSPTRFSIMTGKHPSRVDATNFFAGRRGGRFAPSPLNDRMALSEQTIAEELHDAGYRTAFLGKWHLGPSAEFWPEQQGFDDNFGGFSRGSPPGGYFSPYKNPRLDDGPVGEHLPVRLVDEALGVLDRVKADPFFLYLSFYSVHTPLQAPNKLVEKYQRKAGALHSAPEFADEEQVWQVNKKRQVRIRQRHATYAAMVESMDRQIGRVLDKLEQLNLDENTVVMLTSDNGGLGIREPFMIRWPGNTEANSVCHEPVMSTDFYPTMLEMAVLPSKPKQHLDGLSLVPLLKQEASLEREALYWHYPHYSNQGGFPGGAIRVGDYKLIERFEDGTVHLYNVQNDVGEREDLAKLDPDRVEQLRKRLHVWYKEVDAKFLMPKDGNPDLPWRP